EAAYRAHVPFDTAFRLDDEGFYCTELVEKAYRSAGVVLSEPVPLCCFPRYHRYSYLRPLARVVVGIDVKEPVYAPGNAAYGVYASPALELVYESCQAASPKAAGHRPPRCGAPCSPSF